jgi:hypothetical protein
MEPITSFYARQVNGMRLVDKICIAINEVPSAPSLSVSGAFSDLDTPTSRTEHLDGVIQKRRISQDLHRSKRFW